VILPGCRCGTTHPRTNPANYWRPSGGEQLAGEDFLVGLDRQRADKAGQQLAPVPGLAVTTAAGLARRFTDTATQHERTAIAHDRDADLLDAHHAPDQAAGHRQAAAADRDAAERSRVEADRAEREGNPSGQQVTVPPRPPTAAPAPAPPSGPRSKLPLTNPVVRSRCSAPAAEQESL
jgi:hypothetical protein